MIMRRRKETNRLTLGAATWNLSKQQNGTKKKRTVRDEDTEGEKNSKTAEKKER